MSANALAEPEEHIGTEEAIKWLEEYAFKTGQLGFSTVFDRDKFAKLVDTDTSSTLSTRHHVPSVDSVLEANKAELAHYTKVSRYLQQNIGVLRGAEVIVEERLLAAGMSKEELVKRKKKGFSPRSKVVKLYNLENPPPKEAKCMKVHLMKQKETGFETQDMYFSVNATLDDLKFDLDSLSATVDGRGVHVPNRGKGAWMYQIVDGTPSRDDRLPLSVGSPRRKLLDDVDYRDFVKTVTKKGRKPKPAMLFQESTLQFQRDLLRKETDYDVWSGGLDEEGLPYFQDPDWPMLIKQQIGYPAEEEKGMAHVIHGNTESGYGRATCSNLNTKAVKVNGTGSQSVAAPPGHGESAHSNVETVSGNGQASLGSNTGMNGQRGQLRDHEKGRNGHAEKNADGHLEGRKDSAKSAQCEPKKVRKAAKSTRAPMLETPRRSGRIKEKSPIKYT